MQEWKFFHVWARTPLSPILCQKADNEPLIWNYPLLELVPNLSVYTLFTPACYNQLVPEQNELPGIKFKVESSQNQISENFPSASTRQGIENSGQHFSFQYKATTMRWQYFWNYCINGDHFVLPAIPKGSDTLHSDKNSSDQDLNINPNDFLNTYWHRDARSKI